MRHIFIKYIICFFAFLCGFVLLGSVLPLRAPICGEAVFVQAASLPRPSISHLSGLPLSLSPSVAKEENKAIPSPSPASLATYTAEPTMEGDTLLIRNSTPYAVDTASLLKEPISLSKGEPQVLIMHTHTSEAYTQSDGYAYTPSDPYRTEDQAFNICRVGAALSESLAKNGVSSIVDTTSHDYPSYSGCYGRSLATIQKNLEAHPSISVVIDLHRDAIAGEDGNYLKTAATIDGKTAAQVLVIVGTDAGGLPHPTWQQNLTLGLRVQKDLRDTYPGLARPLHLRTERFNGHVLPGALLVEIGSNGNTMEEALYAAELFGHSLAKTLKSL